MMMNPNAILQGDSLEKRNYIGIELDANYVQIAQKHLDSIVPSSKLHEALVSIYLDKIVTLRDKDWGKLEEHFIIPSPKKELEYKSIVYKYGKSKTDVVVNEKVSTTPIIIQTALPI